MEVLLYEFKAGLNAYLANARTVVRRCARLNDLIAFNEREAAREMPYFGQELFIRAAEEGTADEPAYQRALADVPRVVAQRRASTR